MAHLERCETAMAVQANRDIIALAESAKIEADPNHAAIEITFNNRVQCEIFDLYAIPTALATE